MHTPPPPPHGGGPHPHQPWAQQMPPGAPPPAWPPAPPPASPRHSRVRLWILGGITVVAVIAVTVAVTLALTDTSSSTAGAPTSSTGAPTTSEPAPADTYGLASADDTTAATIITEEPTCTQWGSIVERNVQVQRNGWNQRDKTGSRDRSRDQWTPEERAQYDQVAQSQRRAADEAVALAKQTPHRIIRELYEQFIAYARAYSDAVANYTPHDDHLAGVMISASRAITLICDAITYGAAAARVILIEPVEPPTRFEPLHDPADSKPFMPEPDPVCSEWDALGDRLEQSPVVQAWGQLGGDIPASHWTPEQRDIHLAAAQFHNEFADQIEQAARRSDNPVLQDLAILSAQYRRAYAAAMPTYVLDDAYLEGVGADIFSLIWAACQAAEN